MTTTDDLFHGESQKGGEDNLQSLIDPNSGYLESLVGEGKKFKDAETALKSLVDKENFINQLKTENAGMRKELQQSSSIDDFMKALREEREGTKEGNNQQPSGSQTNTSDNPEPTSTMTAEEVQKLLDEKWSEKVTQDSRSKNLEYVKERLNETIGNNYVERLNQTATELGLSREYLTNLAQTEPKAFLKLVGAETPKPSSSGGDLFTPDPNLNSSGLNFRGEGKKNWEYYEKIRKEDKSRYFSPQVQNEMFKQLAEMGDDFYK